MTTMAHDGQDLTIATPVILPDLLALTRSASAPADTVFAAAKARVTDMASEGGRISAARLEAEQTAAHGLAWLATYVESLRQMQAWAEKLDGEGRFGEIEQLIHQIAFGEKGDIKGLTERHAVNGVNAEFARHGACW